MAPSPLVQEDKPQKKKPLGLIILGSLSFIVLIFWSFLFFDLFTNTGSSNSHQCGLGLMMVLFLLTSMSGLLSLFSLGGWVLNQNDKLKRKQSGWLFLLNIAGPLLFSFLNYFSLI